MGWEGSGRKKEKGQEEELLLGATLAGRSNQLRENLVKKACADPMKVD